MAIDRTAARANCDDTLIAWSTDARIEGCRGFAIQRQRQGKTGIEYVPTWVGFVGEAHKPHESRPSKDWPIQRYSWTDYLVKPGDSVRYRVVAMMRDKPGDPLTPGIMGKWTGYVTVGTGGKNGFHAFFNRGIVPGQWLAYKKLKNPQAVLKKDINDPKSSNRLFLSGCLRPAILDFLADAKRDGVDVYAALYELNDPELIEALESLGHKCHLLLGSGAYKTGVKDENKKERAQLRKDGRIDLSDRLVRSPHFAHNKFLVAFDKNGKPSRVLTGSTNWTVTGLCTQVNNAIIFTSAEIADAYYKRWVRLKNAVDGYPDWLATEGTTPAKAKVKDADVTAWHAPCLKTADLADVRKRIAGAKDGILFLMFNPGPKGTLLNDILAVDRSKLFVQGVINQDPGGKKAPVLKIVQQGRATKSMPLRVAIPGIITDKARKWFAKENRFNMVMIHSKTIVIDPFGRKPVVITGSHNLGPKASGKNDDNFVMIENAPELAEEYAVNIASVFAHYKMRYNEAKRKAAAKGKKKKPTVKGYDGNQDNDKWQDWYKGAEKVQEIDFWA